MADYIVGSLVAVAIAFALRHTYRHFASGECHCSGEEQGSCSEKNCGCAGCHSRQSNS